MLSCNFRPMDWTNEHDLCLCQEILVLEPFKVKKGSVARGQIWDNIAKNLNSLKVPKFKVNKRGVRERYTLLVDKFKDKMREEELGSGMETDLNEVEMAIEEIVEKETLAESETESNSTKKKADNAKATEMRNRAMENMSSTQKRNATSSKQKDDDDDETEDKPKKTRRSGSDTIAYLREKNEMMQQMKMEELEIHKQRAETENKKQDEVRQQHADLMKVLMQQNKQQQDQMQAFQQMFASMQQQQNLIVMKMLEKK